LQATTAALRLERAGAALGAETRRSSGPTSQTHDRDTMPREEFDLTDEIALIARLKDGESAASRHLVDMHLDRLVSYAYRMLNDMAEAEDVAQETFVRLWRNLDSWRPERPLLHWLQRVTHNLCIDRLRKRKPVGIDSVPDLVHQGFSPATNVYREELGASIEVAIRELPDRQRSAILLCHQEGYSNIETAEIMEISVEAVESLLARGRRSLREQLAQLRQELEGDL
jgi:RNA polymerase sigma-70 factor (ECF subfamily)